jgi:long-subunit fatty acid transport protein
MILKNSIGVSYMWNKNTRSMIGMFQMIIKHHQKHNIGQIGYEGLGITKIDGGPAKRKKRVKK